jgi:hypothetical protein
MNRTDVVLQHRTVYLLAKQLIKQQLHDKNKLHSLNEPNVARIQ